MFRGAFERRRCLVPADAFYEWQAVGVGKQSWAFARADGIPLALAGLRQSWRDPAGKIRRTVAIITTDANATMAPAHDRMPVIVQRDAWLVWLGEEPGRPAALLGPAAAGVLRRWLVGRRVNSPRHDGAELLEPVGFPTPPRDDGEAGPDSA